MSTVVRFHELGGPEVLRLEEVDLGEPGPGEVLLDVEAVGLNRSEANFRRDRYLDRVAQLPSGLGYEGAGRVRAVGSGVSEWSPGDRVSVLPIFKQSRYPLYGEQAIVPASALESRPESVSAVDAAAAWMANLTAYGGIVDVARVRPGDPAASSSVGLAAIQIALRVGAIPIATTNSREKSDRLRELGAPHVLYSTGRELTNALLDVTCGRGAEVVFDAVAGPGIEDLAAATVHDGLILVHGSLSGKPTPLPGFSQMRPVYVRPYTLFEFTGDPARLARGKHFVTSGLGSGALKPVIDRVFPLEGVVDAHDYLEAGAQIGKIVMTTGSL